VISKFTGYRHVSTLIAGTLISLGSGFAHAQAVDAQLRALVPAQYQQSGVKVAAFNDWPPDEFAQEGVLKGWSIDMATAMSARLGIKFEITGTSFDAILPGLVSKRFDAGFASFGAPQSFGFCTAAQRGHGIRVPVQQVLFDRHRGRFVRSQHRRSHGRVGPAVP
jgi:ABC-type amino acid transport substrate-binding protein